jgi:imidazole glycerol-phosphate synthase subunit HisF
LNRRIIARLDVKGPNLVKGVHLEGLRVLGDPRAFARYYSQHGADELLYIDVVASLYGRSSIHELISKTARDTDVPITVAGGIRTLDDVRSVLRAGADKVSINTAAVKRPEFIADAARSFGSSTIVVTIEAIRQPSGEYLAFVDNGREETGREVVSWAREAVERGAGEIVITSVDKEGTGEGFDIALTRMVADAVSVPVVACGGAGNAADVAHVLTEGAADAAAFASILHYGLLELADHGDLGSKNEGNFEFVRSKQTYTKIAPLTIESLKGYLADRGVPTRPVH